jgi:hypothetical protein
MTECFDGEQASRGLQSAETGNEVAVGVVQRGGNR